MKLAINPTVLEWALHDAGGPVHELAERAGVSSETLRDWVAGSEQPSLTELRALAAALRRPPSFFFLPEPPATDTPAVAFRAAPNGKAQLPGVDARAALRDAHGMQEFLAWLTRELHLGAAQLPEIRRGTQPHEAAALVREILLVTAEEQFTWRSTSAALRRWRAASESLGVSVFLESMPNGPRGFSISNAWNPVIVVNTHSWNPGARIFTLAHELAHLLRGTDSSCMTIGFGTDDEERWCDRFAAALLMPWDAVVTFLRAKHGWDGKARIDDVEVVRQLADRFKVSMLAAAVRLVSQDVAPGSLLKSIPAVSSSGAGFGPSDPENARLPRRRLQQYGRRTAVLLKQALAREVVTTHEALSRLRCNYSEFGKLMALAEAS